jgi:calcium-dependent protein kinase
LVVDLIYMYSQSGLYRPVHLLGSLTDDDDSLDSLDESQARKAEEAHSTHSDSHSDCPVVQNRLLHSNSNLIIMGNCFAAEESVVSEEEKKNSLRRNMLRSRDDNVYKYYEVVKNLGEGSLGAVRSARKKTVGGSAYTNTKQYGIFAVKRKEGPLVSTSSEHQREYALKSIQLGRVSTEFLDEMRNEIDILRTLDHPNIVKAYEVFETKRQIHIVMDLCAGGDLYTRGPYSEKQSAAIVGKILSGVAYMHSKNVCHRDLKFENIMWESKDKEAEIKLIDFGLSKKYLPGRYMSEGVGTIYTMAPQVLKGVYTEKADLWSIGVITYMLLSSTKPFYHRKRRYMIDRILRCDYNFHGKQWEGVSQSARDFVAALLKLNPNERLTAQQALDHDWLKNSFALSDRRPDEAEMENIAGHITNYGKAGEMKKLALIVMAHKSSTDDIMKLRKAFDQYDSSNDGEVTLSEFRLELSKQGTYSDEEIEKMFASVDVNKEGTISYVEFLAATLEAHGHIEEDRLAEAFDRIDSDDTGYISRKNLEGMLGKEFTEERVDKLLAECDENNDGRIDFNEFYRAFRRSNEGLVNEIGHDVSTATERTESGLLTLSTKIPGV